MSCAACGGALATSLPRVVDPETGEGFAILECQGCGLGHTSPRPEDLAPFYGSDYYGRRHGPFEGACARRRARITRRALGGRRGRLLDIGCGEGTFLDRVRSLGLEVAGTERPEAADAARHAGIAVFTDLAEAASLAPYACITAWHCLEHLPDPRACLLSLRGMLADGGTLVVAVPDAGGICARLFGAHWLHRDVPRHLYHFGKRSLGSLLSASGYLVERWYHQELEYDLLGWMESALHLILPARRVLFSLATGRRARVGIPASLIGLALAAPLFCMAAPATALSTLVHRGGTLIAVAVKRPDGRAPSPA